MDSDRPSRLESASGLVAKECFGSEIGDRFGLYGSGCSQRSPSPAEAVYGDSPRDRADDMGIEEACELNSGWDEEANLIVADSSFPIPLPAANSYNDFSQPARPETPSLNADFDQLFNSDPNGDVMEQTSPGVCGLGNLGNTCFMNSGLQCLFNTPSLVQLFLTHAKDTSSTDTLATQFANLLQKVWSGNYSKVKPAEFQVALAAQHVQFKDYRQHDCQEFLALLLGTLHELLNSASCKSQVSDLSADPMTPRSVCEESAIPATDPAETDSVAQLVLTGSRCEASSSSSRSSESSFGFRACPIPDNVKPFNSPSTTPFLSMETASVANSDDLFGMSDGIDTQICEPENNLILIPEATLKRDSKLVNIAADLNNKLPGVVAASLSDIILKDTKTSNVNVGVPETIPNNQVFFDSGKFPKHENSRRRETCDTRNFTESYDFEEKTGSKRMLSGKLDMSAGDSSGYSSLNASSSYNADNKRCKLDETIEKEKNEVMECARKLNFGDKMEGADAALAGGEGSTGCGSGTLHEYDDDIEADKQWDKHTGLNQSVIVDSFQGQFKSTVVCSECRHASSTYEPFMYLSVPLPHAMEQQLTVTFVPASSAPPTKLLLTLNRQDKVLHIKQQLKTLLFAPESMALELAEVLDHHIARILDEGQLIRCIANSERSIYAFEMSDEVTCVDEAAFHCSGGPVDLDDLMKLNNSDNRKQEGDGKISDFTNNLEKEEAAVHATCEPEPLMEPQPASSIDDPKTCTICLDDTEKPMKNHVNCSCYLCEGCIEMSINHHKENQDDHVQDGKSFMRCPVCNVLVCPDTDLVDVDDSSQRTVTTRTLNIPVLFREDVQNDVTTAGLPRPHDRDSKPAMTQQLFGHPHILRIANRISASIVWQLISRLVPYDIHNYTVLLVDGQGYHCSRCMYNTGCRGCHLPRSGEYTFRSIDSLAVIFNAPIGELPLVEHETLHNLRKQDNLSIYDCLSAFCESERLDEQNPWYCPRCECNQSAIKTLSVWRYPDYLIVYLKRFVFYEYTSVKLDNKVSFPLTDLTLPSHLPDMSLNFDLYACVNHLGGASAGHYTAYAKNPESRDWHLFNDETVTAQKPQETDFNHAYILFYQLKKDGLPQSLMNPCLSPAVMNAERNQLPFEFASVTDSSCP